jgi:hypothetical protein
MMPLTRLSPAGVPMSAAPILATPSIDYIPAFTIVVPPQVWRIDVPPTNHEVVVPAEADWRITAAAQVWTIDVPLTLSENPMATEVKTKQPDEIVTGDFDWSIFLEVIGTVLNGDATLFASDASGQVPDIPTALTVAPITGTLTGAAALGVSTINTSANPRAGARLSLNAAGDNAEMFKVVSVTGAASPFACALDHPLFFAHLINEPWSAEPGVSAQLIVDTTSTPAATNTRSPFQVRYGVHNHLYRISILAPMANTDARSWQFFLLVVDD